MDGPEPPPSPRDEGAADTRYQVEITGGRGAVVGDYATVFQVFTQAPTALSSLIRSRDFQALVDERTRNFVGRDFVFAAMDEAFADEDFRSGYLVVQGEPGIGKTALTGQLVKERGYVHHFNVAPLGIRSPQAFLSNVCAQLIIRYELGYPGLPAEATQDGGFLSRLLAEAAAEPEHLPLVVVVDALDEAEDVGLPPGANRLFLPPSLPAGVYVVVSTRPEYDYRLFVDSRRDIYLRDDDPQNLEDVRSYTREYLRSNREPMEAQLGRWGVSEDEFVDLITAKSEGNFMYLVHVLRDIRSGALTADTVGDIQKLPQGLKDYYRRHWNDMRSADREHFRRYQQPVVCLLATVREPVSRPQLLEWTTQFWSGEGWDPAALDRFAVQDVLNAWHEFLNEDTVDGETRYRVYHASFQDFLADEVGLTAYHETIGDTALAKIPGFLDGG
jgi:AAA ATPase domain